MSLRINKNPSDCTPAGFLSASLVYEYRHEILYLNAAGFYFYQRLGSRRDA